MFEHNTTTSMRILDQIRTLRYACYSRALYRVRYVVDSSREEKRDLFSFLKFSELFDISQRQPHIMTYNITPVSSK